MPANVFINDECTIPGSDLRLETGRSSGPGGQHVNKTETRVTLVFDLSGATALSDAQRSTLLAELAGRLTKEGELRLSSQSSRSQKANREDVIERFAALLREALTPRPVRKATRVPARAKRKRRDDKKKRAEKKHQRRPADWDQV
jgi:ribosome-associated protein